MFARRAWKQKKQQGEITSEAYGFKCQGSYRIGQSQYRPGRKQMYQMRYVQKRLYERHRCPRYLYV